MNIPRDVQMCREQRCVFGIHRAITPVQAKPFGGWFNRADNGGFVPYDASSLQLLVRGFVSPRDKRVQSSGAPVIPG